jgi:hypothetical protein
MKTISKVTWTFNQRFRPHCTVPLSEIPLSYHCVNLGDADMHATARFRSCFFSLEPLTKSMTLVESLDCYKPPCSCWLLIANIIGAGSKVDWYFQWNTMSASKHPKLNEKTFFWGVELFCHDHNQILCSNPFSFSFSNAIVSHYIA